MPPGGTVIAFASHRRGPILPGTRGLVARAGWQPGEVMKTLDEHHSVGVGPDVASIILLERKAAGLSGYKPESLRHLCAGGHQPRLQEDNGSFGINRSQPTPWES